MAHRRLLTWSIVAIIGLTVAGAASYLSYAAGQRNRPGIRPIEGTIALVNYDPPKGASSRTMTARCAGHSWEQRPAMDSLRRRRRSPEPQPQ